MTRARSVRTRLLVAAAACVVSLGFAWQLTTELTPKVGIGYYVTESYVSPSTGDVSYGTVYQPGAITMNPTLLVLRGAQDEVRVPLVGVAIALTLAAVVRTRRTLRAARVAGMVMVVLAVIAGTRGRAPAAALLALAVIVVAPVLWPGRAAAWRRRISVPLGSQHRPV